MTSKLRLTIDTGTATVSVPWTAKSAGTTTLVAQVAGTDRGVFHGRSIDHGLTWFWRPYNNGMPLADVRDLEVHPTTGIMRAFTHGRSAYEVTTSHDPGGVVMAAKRASKSSTN
jgi:hypothetical protein